MELIKSNILASLGLDEDGKEAGQVLKPNGELNEAFFHNILSYCNVQTQGSDDDGDQIALKSAIKQVLELLDFFRCLLS